MSIDLTTLFEAQRVLFEIPLQPLQGQRFQPTGFPSLGAATFQTSKGACLLVESAQSMANRLELTVWDESANDVKTELQGLSHVKVDRGAGTTPKQRSESKERLFFTDSIIESHRINSPYILVESKKTFFNELKSELGGLEIGPIDRTKLCKALLKFDVGSLLHGTFLAKKDLAGGRLRVARAFSAFIEADGVRVAPSGGVKNDHVNPSGDTKAGFGNVPFARDEYTAERITLYVNIDLAQIRGYGLGEKVERMMILLALYKLRALIHGGMRLRTACDFRAVTGTILATVPEGFALPALKDIASELRTSIDSCKGLMTVTQASFDDDLKTSKDKNNQGNTGENDDDADDTEE